MTLSILIPHLKAYDPYLKRLREVLEPQMDQDMELIIWADDGRVSIGEKRNWLLQKAKGEYVCFIDSDDLVSHNYVDLLMQGIELGVDCCSLRGEITFDGKNPKPFIHSIKYRAYKEVNGVYERFPNHLNCIKANIAKQFRFPSINHGEDTDWATQIFKSGLLKVEYWIEPTIYFYEYRSKK